MAKVDSGAIEEIKQKIDIVEYVGKHVDLKKAGRNFKANCPFHNEKSPSFMVSPDRQLWRCFGACHEGGDVIAFVMKIERITFFEALNQLAREVGVTLKKVDFEDHEWKKKEKLLQIHALSAKYYHYLLTEHALGKDCLEYLKKRDISEKLIKTFQLGFAPPAWDNLVSYLKKKKYTESELEDAGLIIKSSKGSYYDRFRGRLMFPIFDQRNNIIAFSGRLLADDAKQAKYVNSPETMLYHKRDTLFGIQLAKDEIIKQNKVVIVEGEFDMISCFKHGITNTCAIKGSAFTQEQLDLLKRYTNHLILALDIDLAGADSTKRSFSLAEKMDFRIDVVRFTDGKDPDEALKNNAIEFKKNIAKPEPIYDFVINNATQSHNLSDPYEKDKAVKEVLPFISSITNPIVLTHYLNTISSKFDVSMSILKEMQAKLNRTQKKKALKIIAPIQNTNKKEHIERFILATILQNPEPRILMSVISPILKAEDFSTPAMQQIYTALSHYTESQKSQETVDEFKVSTFIKNLDTPVQHIADELVLEDISFSDGVTKLDRTAYQLKKTVIKELLNETLKKDPNSPKTTSLKEELVEVEKHLL